MLNDAFVDLLVLVVRNGPLLSYGYLNVIGVTYISLLLMSP